MDRRAFLKNPYRPGAGHFPPYFAGRDEEQVHFKRMLRDSNPTDNFLVTGLRGFGKTVLLDCMRRMAAEHGWLWVGNDLSESSSLNEERLAVRVLTDLATAINSKIGQGVGYKAASAEKSADTFGLDQQTYNALKGVYENSPGLPSDRLKAVVSMAASLAARARLAGILLAYDEAQCLSDHAERDEYPMSMLIETIGSMQRAPAVVPVVLVLAGLPHVQDALTETRTYTERMFHVLHLDRLSRNDTWAALANPLQELMPPLHASQELMQKAVDLSGGYPYLIQFFGKELVESLMANGGMLAADAFPNSEALERLDAGLFGARWNKTTDKQRYVLGLLANRGLSAPNEFSAQDVAALSGTGGAVNSAQATQVLQALCDRGLIYRTRHGRYAFTVPLSEEMILRRLRSGKSINDSWRLDAEASSGPAAPPSPARRKRGWFG